MSAKHKNVLALVRKHLRILIHFGEVAFQTRLNTQGCSTEMALLNKRQAALLTSLMRNSDEVIASMANITDLEKTLRNISKQVKFAQSRALTRVARSIQEKEQHNIESRFDNPTPFTVKLVQSIGARRDNLQAKLFIQDIAAGYLDPYEYGGFLPYTQNGTCAR